MIGSFTFLAGMGNYIDRSAWQRRCRVRRWHRHDRV
jgi:hypothetical protein